MPGAKQAHITHIPTDCDWRSLLGDQGGGDLEGLAGVVAFAVAGAVGNEGLVEGHAGRL